MNGENCEGALIKYVKSPLETMSSILINTPLRFYQLGQIPLSLDWDEASNAYNAYSILKTARDEYGKLLPLYSRSFDDYKPPAYMYMEVPAVSIFGLTQFAARLPSAIVGVLTILVIYYYSTF